MQEEILIPEQGNVPELNNIKEDVSLINDNITFLKEEYEKYLKNLEKENNQDVENLEVVGFEEVVSSIGVLSQNVENMNENIIHLNTSISFFIGIIIGLSVVSYIWKGVLKNVF